MALLSCVFRKIDRPSGRKLSTGTGARMKMDLQAGKESDYFKSHVACNIPGL